MYFAIQTADERWNFVNTVKPIVKCLQV